jgi:hypothetical protein
MNQAMGLTGLLIAAFSTVVTEMIESGRLVE